MMYVLSGVVCDVSGCLVWRVENVYLQGPVLM